MKRNLNLLKLLTKQSHFLFGPRGVGKSYLIRKNLLGNDQISYIDLLNSKNYLRLNSQPSALESYASKKIIVIDEVQRIPELLNEVHRLIEEKKKIFLLTGSSARSLKRGGANLLAGRALRADLFPFTYHELSQESAFDLNKYLITGGLPMSYLSSHPWDYLYNYLDTYLKEEIQAEALVRNLANYHRFLESAANYNTQILNFTKIANDAQLSPNTVRDYYGILEDTLIGYLLPAWTKSKKRKALQTAKFYFFDLGIVHAIREVEHLEPQSDLYGRAFEHFIINEIRAYLSYKGIRKKMFYWQSTSQYEVDLIIGDIIAIEIKSSNKVIPKQDYKGLRAIAEEKKWKHLLVVSRDEVEQQQYGIQSINWMTFLNNLWTGKYV